MTGRQPSLAQEIERVRRLLVEASSYLPPDRIRDVDELLRNDEPQEALLTIAWQLAAQVDELPEHIVRLIRDAAGSDIDLPDAFGCERRQDRYATALREATQGALAAIEPRAAAVNEGDDDRNDVWGLDITPMNVGPAPVHVTYIGGDTVVLGFGRTEVELWEDDPWRMGAEVERYLEAIFAGRFVEAIRPGDSYALVTFADGSRASVGRAHLPWPWRLRLVRRYPPYGRRSSGTGSPSAT